MTWLRGHRNGETYTYVTMVGLYDAHISQCKARMAEGSQFLLHAYHIIKQGCFAKLTATWATHHQSSGMLHISDKAVPQDPIEYHFSQQNVSHGFILQHQAGV